MKYILKLNLDENERPYIKECSSQKESLDFLELSYKNWVIDNPELSEYIIGRLIVDVREHKNHSVDTFGNLVFER